VDYTNLGLPKLGKESAPAQERRVNDMVYRGFLTPVVVYGGIVAIVRNRWKEHMKHGDKPGSGETHKEEKRA
jgi:hypothetical protein